MNFHMNTGPTDMEPIAGQLYQEIGLIDEEHVTHYESLVDPGETWREQLVNHEYEECRLYHSFMEQESDPRVRYRQPCRHGQGGQGRRSHGADPSAPPVSNRERRTWRSGRSSL